MIRFRPFLNSDSPGLAMVWNSQPPLRGRLSRMTPAILEQYVLAKPYFDPRGLIVAVDDGTIVGFVHAGFCPGERAGELDRTSGLICQLLVHPQAATSPVATELLRRGEDYLRGDGAAGFLGGAAGSRAPYYLGLYGGCNLPGVLVGDSAMIAALRETGYVEHHHYRVLQRELSGFRAPVDRQLVQLRRQFRLAQAAESPSGSWCEACTYSWADPLRFAVMNLNTDEVLATLMFWDMEPLSSSWGIRAMGLLEARCETACPQENLLPCFLGEAMRLFQEQGMALVEVQAAEPETALIEGCWRLGFREIDRGIQFRKPA